MRRYSYGESAYAKHLGFMRRVQVIVQSATWTKVCLGYEGHATAIYGRVRTDSLLPLPYGR